MRARAALVLIEFQQEWLADGGKIRHLLRDGEQVRVALDSAAAALAVARRRGLAVVHCGLRFQPGYPELGAAVHGLRAAIPRAGTWVGPGREFVPAFAPAEGEFVVAGRVGGSAFAGSNLDAFLRNQGVGRVYLAGFALHVCVLATLCQGHDLGYDVVVLEDACAAFTPDQRRAVLDDIVPHFGSRVTVAEFAAGDGPDAEPDGVLSRGALGRPPGVARGAGPEDPVADHQ